VIFVTVRNHDQAQPVTGGPYAGMVRFTGYLYADPEEAALVATPTGHLVGRLVPCICDGGDRADCGVHGTARARGEL
jgi:hypothetical protein